MENYAIQCAEWLERQVRNAEQQDAQLRSLKNQINDLTTMLKSASDDQVPHFLRQQDQVIHDLIDHVASKKPYMQRQIARPAKQQDKRT